MPDPEESKYRPCAGICLFNAKGLVFVGARKRLRDTDGSTQVWQMPQGGIDDGEDPESAARRELYEETNVTSVDLVGELAEWLTYDLPPGTPKTGWRRRYCGQAQKWFAFRFRGQEDEIDVMNPGGGGHKPEFLDWKWVRLAETPSLVVPFKRPVYEQVVAGFAGLARDRERRRR